MIVINQNSIDEIQEKHNHTTANIEKIDILLSTDVKDLNDRLNNIDTDCSSTDHIVNKLEEVAKVKESLKSVIARVDSIQQLFILRSSYNKRMRESKRSGVSSVATTESQDNSPPLTDHQNSTTNTKVSDESSSTPAPSPTTTGNNKREDVATELHYQHANEGLQDPIPIEVIMSLLEKHDDDAVATLRHMRSLESEYNDEDDAVGSDFTDDSSSDEESLCFSTMDEEEEDDDYDSSTSDDDELLDKDTLALLEANRSSPNHPIHSFKPEDMLLFNMSDRKKPRKKKKKKKKKTSLTTTSTTRRPRKSGLPDCSILGCTRVVDRRGLCREHACGTKKCSVDGCKANAYRLGLCTRHYQPCSKPGCIKHGQFVSDNGRYCYKHARTEAPEAYNRWRQQKSCTILGCDKEGKVSSNNSRYCLHHAKTGAPEAYAEYCERRNRQRAERYRTDIKYRLSMLVRRRLHHALKAQGTSYRGKNKLLGCTVDQFKRYLEQFFSEPGNDWMNWKNHGRGILCWEIDHIYPLSELDLTDPEQLRRAQHWSNFQPLSAADNNEKKAKIPDGFEWNGSRWMWSEESGRINYKLM